MNLDRINEASKMAAVKASSALSKLIQQPVGVAISPAITLQGEGLPLHDGAEEKMVGITVPLSGDLQGLSLMFFTQGSALALCDILLKRDEHETKKFDEMEISALTEVANIVIGNFLGPFAHPFQLDKLMHHIPKFNCDTYQDLLTRIHSSLNEKIQERLLVEILITLQHLKVRSFLIFLLGLEEIQNVLEK